MGFGPEATESLCLLDDRMERQLDGAPEPGSLDHSTGRRRDHETDPRTSLNSRTTAMVTTPMPAPMISARAQPGRSLTAFMDREDSSHDRAARMSFVDLQVLRDPVRVSGSTRNGVKERELKTGPADPQGHGASVAGSSRPTHRSGTSAHIPRASIRDGLLGRRRSGRTGQDREAVNE